MKNLYRSKRTNITLPYCLPQVNLYRILPFRSLSRLWGRVNSLEVPLFLRAPMYSLYVRLFNCNLSEALVEDLKQYRNLQDFFMRELKPDVRPVDAHHMLVSIFLTNIRFSNVTKKDLFSDLFCFFSFFFSQSYIIHSTTNTQLNFLLI